MPETPITREEMYLSYISSGEGYVPEPVTREEMFLAKAAGKDIETPTPITRKEMYLNEISGGGGKTLIEKYITSNGEYNPSDDNADGYSLVTVDIPEWDGGSY